MSKRFGEEQSEDFSLIISLLKSATSLQKQQELLRNKFVKATKNNVDSLDSILKEARYVLTAFSAYIAGAPKSAEALLAAELTLNSIDSIFQNSVIGSFVNQNFKYN